MDQNTNKNDKDKLRVVTAEEVLEELRRRKKEYGSVFLPTNSYQVIKNKKKEEENKTQSNSKNVSSVKPEKKENLRKAVLFLESFAFKKPLQTVVTVLMFLGITTGMYLATRPVGELDNRNQASIPEAVFFGIVDKNSSQYPTYSTPNIYCNLTDLQATFTAGVYSNCLAKNIITRNITKVVVVSKPDFLNIVFDSANSRIAINPIRDITNADKEKAYSIKLLGIPNDETSYKLLAFTLKISDALSPTAVGALTVRNPVSSNSGSLSGCEATDESGSKGRWQTYATGADCNSALHNPVITTPSSVDINYETECHNNPVQKTISFNVTATDTDGDLTRFEVDKSSAGVNNARIEESLANYIPRVVSEVDSQGLSSYATYQYKNSVKLDIQPQDIGKTIPIKVLALNQNNSSYNVSKVVNVNIKEKVVNTDPNLGVTVITPKKTDTLKGQVSVNWSVNNSCDFTRYKVEIWDKYCTTFKAKLTDETFVNVAQTGSTFNTAWDTRNISDGQYCARVFVRNSLDQAWRVGSTGSFTVQNTNNHAPSIISLPTTTNIKVGDTFNYAVKTSDSDNDQVTVIVDKKPSWLTLGSNNTLSGSTTTAGKYDVTLRAEDAKGAFSAAQMFSITVSPSGNTPSVIAFDPFPTANTISGAYTFKWTVSDSDGIKSQELDISSDAETWTKLSDLKATDRSFALDTTKDKDGEYYLKLIVTDNKSDVVEKLTDKFVILNTEANTSITVASHTPASDEKITDVRPTLSLKLVLPVGVTLDSSKLNVTLDETVISTLCSYTVPVITCTLDKDLALGSHKVNVEYYDNTGVKGAESFQFEIISASSSSTSSVGEIQATAGSDTITIFGRSISKALGILLLVLCIAGILIFLIPLLIFKVWKKKDTGDSDNPPVTPTPAPIKSAVVPTKSVESTKTVSTYSFDPKKEVVPERKVEEIKNRNVVVSNPIVKTPTNTTYTNDQISSFQKPNNYANLRESNGVVNSEDLSKPKTTWGLAERYQKPVSEDKQGSVGSNA